MLPGVLDLKGWLAWPALVLAISCCPLVSPAGTLSDPEVDRFNVRVGTQIFGLRYQFTSTNVLVEAALEMRSMGSDLIKFQMGSGAAASYGYKMPGGVTSLETQARLEPNTRTVLNLPFRHFFIWANTISQEYTCWNDGLSSIERSREYNESFAFACYLLTTYNNSGKSFYLGHWEGDWLLLRNYDATVNPSTTRIEGMRDWLNTRQLAVDDARRTVPHSNVSVYVYAEVNRVRDAMRNGSSSNQRVVNAVLPAVTNLDFVSYSSYDAQDLPATELHATLDYIESNLSTNKNSLIPGRRVFIGEYGWGKGANSSNQEPVVRAFWQKVMPWGAPFLLFWELYNNEPGQRYWLVDDTGLRTPCYALHRRFANDARLEVARFKERNGRIPTEAEFSGLADRLLSRPPTATVPLEIRTGPVADVRRNTVTVTSFLDQGVYGDEIARSWVYWGPTDGGTNAGAWAERTSAGQKASFNTMTLSASLTNLVAGTNYFRFFASNATAQAWAPTSSKVVAISSAATK